MFFNIIGISFEAKWYCVREVNFASLNLLNQVKIFYQLYVFEMKVP